MFSTIYKYRILFFLIIFMSCKQFEKHYINKISAYSNDFKSGKKKRGLIIDAILPEKKHLIDEKLVLISHSQIIKNNYLPLQIVYNIETRQCYIEVEGDTIMKEIIEYPFALNDFKKMKVNKDSLREDDGYVIIGTKINDYSFVINKSRTIVIIEKRDSLSLKRISFFKGYEDRKGKICIAPKECFKTYRFDEKNNFKELFLDCDL